MSSRTPGAPAAPARGLRRALALGAASGLLLGTAACATSAEDGAPDLETDADTQANLDLLDSAAERSLSEGYHVEVFMSLTGEPSADGPPLLAGDFAGERFDYRMDMGPMMREMAEMAGDGSMPPGLASFDMSIDLMGDDEHWYMRAPIYGELGAALPPGADDLAAIGDGWGVVDVVELGEHVPSDVAEALGGQGADPAATVGLLREADDVEELGDDEIDGRHVTGLAADTTLGDLLEASGQDPDSLAETTGYGARQEEMTAGLFDTVTTIEVWVDDDGRLLRMAYGYDSDDLAGAMDMDDAVQDTGLGDMEFNYLVEMSDHGLTVEITPPGDAVDITEGFAALATG